MIDWNKITPERFEQLCSDIIESEGFYNIRRLGATGDRGRDILAQKDTQLLYGTKEVNSWVIQCKRYVNTNLTIESLSSELTKARMHKPDYYLLMITNSLNPNLYDWLESVKNQYLFKIIVFDIDWLNRQLERQPSLYKRYFENDKSKFLYETVRNTSDIQIYTAGKMPTEAIRSAITWWRSELEQKSKKFKIKIGFFHPEFAGCDHTGINMSETVQMDFRMISQSNLVIAYLDNVDQFGTLTEIMAAYSMNKQLAIFIDESINFSFSVPDTTEDGEFANMQYYKEVYSKVFNTNHTCPCDLMNELKPIHTNNYWFMIEFLRLRHPDTYFKMTTKAKVIDDMMEYLGGFKK